MAGEAQALTEAGDLFAAFKARSRFGSLDGLRALSVLAVVWFHTSSITDLGSLQLLARTHQGVTLFFAISGFLIVTLLLRERERRGRIDLKAFYIRRSLRIFPLYYATLAVYLALVLVVERSSPSGREFLGNLVYFLTYTSNWFVLNEGRVIFYFAWSLAMEEQFYLVWPYLQATLTPRRALAAILLFIGIVAVVQLSAYGVPAAERGRVLRIAFGVPLAICFGVVLALTLNERRGYAFADWLFGHKASPIAWMMILLGCLAWKGTPDVAIHAAAVGLVGASVYREDHYLRPLLASRPLVHIGMVSYGIYLLHMLVKNVVLKVAGAAHIELASVPLFTLTVLGAIVVATVSFTTFEAHFQRWKPVHASA